ncbi:tripartite tricarboxylate transporter substrate binding protein [Microbaculum marinum]|uniref:Tripartite tricarboxylate transporter substrate binding protein n=1 Tax=Microbaculum marinum TaxID=1764581 RepID=A0AAW9S357_9HYPH
MPATALADEYPDGTVTLLVGYAPGGGTDLVARTLADGLARKWDETVIVENRPGGTGTIGIRTLQQAKPDGYTLGVWTDSDVGNSAVRDDLDYDLVDDFEQITQLAAGATMLVANPKAPVKNFDEFIAYSKENPGKLNFAVVSGGGMHLDTLRINDAAGVETAIIGYPGTGPALNDVVAGHVDILLLPLGAALPYIEAGTLQPIAVGSPEPWPGLPDVPTMSDTIPGLETTFFYGLAGPKGMSEELKNKISTAVQEVLKDPEIAAKFEARGFLPTESSPEHFKKVLSNKLDVSRSTAEKTGLKQN